MKKRFPIIASGTEPHYDLHTVTNIVLACFMLHNFFRRVDNDESLIEEVDLELLQQDVHVFASQARDNDYKLGSHIRDTIAERNVARLCKQLIL